MHQSSSPPTCFTCQVSSNAGMIDHTGMTDKLQRFDLCYALGISLGYEYIHTPFECLRSAENLDHLLGFEDYFCNNIGGQDLSRFERVEINLTEIWHKEKFLSLQQLQDFIRLRVSRVSNISRKRIVVVLIFVRIYGPQVGGSASMWTPLNRILRITPLNKLFQKKSQRKLAAIYPVRILSNWLSSPQFDHLDFRSIYFQARQKDQRSSNFVDGKLRMLVHIRQGDTAFVETPWHTYVPTWLKHHEGNPVELDNLEQAGNMYVQVDEYYTFLSQFLSCFDDNTFSVIVSSDGFKRSFQNLYDWQSILDFTESQIQSLKEMEKSYDEKVFAPFTTLNHCTCLIGETDENLFGLIHSVLTADIIVVGTQQKMVLKLLNLFGDDDHPPILIVLHKFKNPARMVKRFKLHHETRKIIPVNLKQMEIESVVARFNEAMI
jgi:hypothetical protein